MQSVSFCCAPLGAATFRRGQSKRQNTTQGVFFCSGPGERQGKEKPRWAPARGQSKKKHHPGCFFLLRPRRKAREGEAPLGAGRGPEQKKNTTQGVFFFCSGPGERQGKEKQRGFSFPCLSPGPEQKKKHPGWCFFFALVPCRRPTGLLLRWLFAGAAAKNKKHPRWCFFFCSGPVPAPNGASPSLAFRRGRSKKKTPWVVSFFLLRPRADAHSLTAGLGGDASPSPGWCFFFCCGPARTGVVFFFLLWPRPDAHSLTVGWGDFGKARVHSKKKNTTSPPPPAPSLKTPTPETTLRPRFPSHRVPKREVLELQNRSLHIHARDSCNDRA